MKDEKDRRHVTVCIKGIGNASRCFAALLACAVVFSAVLMPTLAFAASQQAWSADTYVDDGQQRFVEPGQDGSLATVTVHYLIDFTGQGDMPAASFTVTATSDGWTGAAGSATQREISQTVSSADLVDGVYRGSFDIKLYEDARVPMSEAPTWRISLQTSSDQADATVTDDGATYMYSACIVGNTAYPKLAADDGSSCRYVEFHPTYEVEEPADESGADAQDEGVASEEPGADDMVEQEPVGENERLSGQDDVDTEKPDDEPRAEDDSTQRYAEQAVGKADGWTDRDANGSSKPVNREGTGRDKSALPATSDASTSGAFFSLIALPPFIMLAYLWIGPFRHRRPHTND